MKWCLILVIVLAGCGWNAEAPVDDVALLITQWVYDTIEYEAMPEWQTPAYTLETGTGDCVNMVLLAMDMLHDMGIHSVMIAGYYDGKPHGWLGVNGEWYEVTAGIRIYDRSLYEVEYYVTRGQAIVFEIVI